MATTTFQDALKRQLDQNKAPQPTTYSQYSQVEYDKAQQAQSEPFKYEAPKDTASGKSIFDIQRERVSQSAQNQQKSISDALRRRLAAQGISGGVENKQLRNIAVETAKAEAQGLTDVGLTEAQAAEAARQTNQQQQYATRERLGTQAFNAQQYAQDQALQRESLYAGLSQQEVGLAENARQFDTQQSFNRWATEQGWNQDAINRAWQSEEAAKARASTEKIATSQLTENARQFNTQQDFQKWATQGGWSQDEINRAWQSSEAEKTRQAQSTAQDKELAQQASQFTNKMAFDKWVELNKVDEATAARLWTAQESALDRAMQKEFSVREYNVQAQQLAQQARQFDTELAFKKWATESGYAQEDVQRAWQAQQNAAQIASQEKMQTAELTQADKQLSQQASQFTTEMAFKKWAQLQGADEAQAARAWQSSQNDQDRLQQTALAKMQQQGQLTLQERELAQQSYQFASQQEFQKWATTQGWAQDEIARSWQASQTAKQIASEEKMQGLSLADQAATREFQAVQSEKDRLFQKYLAEQNLSVEQQKIAQESQQFTDKLSFDKWAANNGYAQADAERAWQSREAALNRTAEKQRFQANLSQQADQFSTEQEFKRWATESGYEQEDAARAWQSAENAKQRGSAETMAKAELSLREKELKQNSAQFTSELGFKTYALESGYSEAEAARTWQEIQNQKDRDFQAKQTKSAQDYAERVRTGYPATDADGNPLKDAYGRPLMVAGTEALQLLMQNNQISAQERIAGAEAELQKTLLTEKQKYDAAAQAAGFDEAKKQRDWQAIQNGIEQGFRMTMQTEQFREQRILNEDQAAANLAASKELEKLRYNLLAGYTDERGNVIPGTLQLEQAIAERNTTSKLKADSYYSRGLTGENITGAELETLRADPIAYFAYEAGKSGKDKAEYDNELAYREKVINAMITASSEKQTPDFIADLKRLSTMLGYDNVVNFNATGAAAAALLDKYKRGEMSYGEYQSALADVEAGDTSAVGGDLAGFDTQVMDGVYNFSEVDFSGQDDAKYQYLLQSSAVPDYANSPSKKYLNRDVWENQQFEEAVANGTPIKKDGRLYYLEAGNQYAKADGTYGTTYNVYDVLTNEKVDAWKS